MKKVLLFADGRKAKALDVARDLQSWLSKRKIHSSLEDSPKKFDAKNLKGIDLVVSLGGDGTILLLAHATAPLGIPILPVDLGGLGFLATCQPSSARKALSQIIEGDFKIENRMMMSVKLLSGGRVTRSFRALNEVLIHKGSLERLIHLRTMIGDEPVTTYSADGLIVATPTGSTAYSLSAGGPMVSPKLEAFVVTAICPHALSVRPIVISAEETLRIVSDRPDRKIILTCDGLQSVKLKREEILVEKAAEPCKIIQMDAGFYRSLKIKMQWAGEYRRLDLGETR